ncbi:hypothetical protein Trydic_g2200 [Trypoxylus dichotomus]
MTADRVITKYQEKGRVTDRKKFRRLLSEITTKYVTVAGERIRRHSKLSRRKLSQKLVEEKLVWYPKQPPIHAEEFPMFEEDSISSSVFPQSVQSIGEKSEGLVNHSKILPRGSSNRVRIFLAAWRRVLSCWKIVFELLKIWNNSGFHYLINVRLGAHGSLDEC